MNGGLPPTDWELARDRLVPADNGICSSNWCDGDPEYSGTRGALSSERRDQDYELAYFGDWRMEDDCIWLHLFDGAVLSC